MRAPRSPCGCGLSVICIRATIFKKLSCVASGAQHKVTGPMPAASAVATVRSVKRSCRTAAACAPIVGISRVLAKPGIGAVARIAIDTELGDGDVAMTLSFQIGADGNTPGEAAAVFSSLVAKKITISGPGRSRQANQSQFVRDLAT